MLSAKGHHWHMGIIIGIFTTIAAAVFAAKPNNTVAVFVSQYLSAVSFAGQTVFFSWANIVCINDLQERAIVLASMNMFSNAVNAWWSILFYGADTAPEFKRLLGIACNRNRQYWCCCSDTSVARKISTNHTMTMVV